jgi:hypothetical protein
MPPPAAGPPTGSASHLQASVAIALCALIMVALVAW